MLKLNLAFLSVIICLAGPAKAFEKLAIGQTVFVACKNINLMKEASSFSPVLSSLTFGDQVTVLELKGEFELPDSDFSSKVKLEAQLQMAAGDGEPAAVQAEDYTRAAWVKIKQGQFVSAACLVSEENFSEQTMEKAEKKVAQLSSGTAKRNFSEEEDGDMRAMRGAAGKAKGGTADFLKIDSLITENQGLTNLSTLKDFRKSGRLGEFK